MGISLPTIWKCVIGRVHTDVTLYSESFFSLPDSTIFHVILNPPIPSEGPKDVIITTTLVVVGYLQLEVLLGVSIHRIFMTSTQGWVRWTKT